MKRLALLLTVFAFFTPLQNSYASGVEEIYTIIIKKQVKKRQNRWSLATWLEIKETMRQQDMWLALHSSDTTFEGYFDGGYTVPGTDLSSNNLETAQAPQVEFGFYNRIFGVQGQWVDEGTESGTGMNGSLHLRIFGGSVQNSNITLGYGIRERNEPFEGNTVKFSNQYAEVSSTLYLTSFLGIQGTYQQFFTNDSSDVSLSGSRIEAGAFLDISFTQIYLNFYDEPIEFNNSGTKTESKRQGYTGGLRLFF